MPSQDPRPEAVQSAVGDVTGAHDSPPGAGPGPAAPPKQLGDFRILREVGHGGMGVVYEAEQVSLGRRVALKLLPAGMLHDSRRRQRFEREAKAAARLHHTNIVPVFGVGEHEGQPYYVMQFIDGRGLDVVLREVIRLKNAAGGPRPPDPPSPTEMPIRPEVVSVAAVARSLLTVALETGDQARAAGPAGDAAAAPPLDKEAQPTHPASLLGEPPSGSPPAGGMPGPGSGDLRRRTYWLAVARVGARAADALHYAHKQGVLHRDVKPANLLLDAAGAVWVADFGLAKAEDQEDLTQTGDVLGTLRYMPPEAFEGRADARSDVYALGLTLYELLALRPAFDEKDQKKLIKQVTAGEPPRLDRVNPAVPRDLVTVVHKAADRDPARRYQTAGDLAADLLRFLNDEPIKARRQTQLERYLRWARRNPGIAVLGAVLTAVLVLGLAASLLAAGHFNRLRLNEAQSAQNERTARLAAEKAGDAERWERYRSNIAAASAALQLQKSDMARRALEAAPEEHRNWEWRHFHNQLDGASRVLSVPDWNRDYQGRLPLFAFRPDERQFATAAGPTVNLWDANSPAGRPEHVLRGHAGPIGSLTYSPDGRQLATGPRDSVHLWDPATGRQLFELPAEGVPHLAYSSDGTRLISDEDGGKCRLWDTTTGKLVAIVGDGHPAGYGQGVAFSPDGKRVAAAVGKEVRLYDAATGRRLASLGPHEWPVQVVFFSPDGKRICTHQVDGPGRNMVYLWDAETGTPIAPLADHGSTVHYAVFNAKGTLLATASDHPENLVRLWDATDGKLLHTLPGHANSLNDLRFSPDGTRLASASLDQTARLWDVQTGAEIAVLRGHWSQLGQATFSPDGTRLVTGSDDHTMRLWDARRGDLIAVLRGHDGTAWGQFTRDGSHLISISEDGTVRFWDLNLLERNGVLRGHTSFVYDVAFSPDGEQVASVAWDGTARLWDPTTGRQASPLKHPKPYVTSLALSRDGRTLATANTEYGAVLWDLATGQPHLAVPLSWHARVTLSPDGTILACDNFERGRVALYNTSEQKQFAELAYNDPEAPENRLTGDPLFSPDGATLVTNAAGGKVLLWDVAAWKVRGSLPAYTGGALRFAFSPDSQLLAVSARADNTLRLCDVRTREQLAKLDLGNPILGLAFSPDGTRLAAGCRDNTIRLIDVATRQEVAELRGHTDYVNAVAWSPDGTRLVSGSGDGTVRIWDSLSVQERAKRAADARRP